MSFPPENPYASPPPIPPEPREKRSTFYMITVTLLFVALAATFIKMGYDTALHRIYMRQFQRKHDIQENRESRPEVIAGAEVDEKPIRLRFVIWWAVSHVTAVLAIISWVVTICRREKHSWLAVVILLFFYINLQLIII